MHKSYPSGLRDSPERLVALQTLQSPSDFCASSRQIRFLIDLTVPCRPSAAVVSYPCSPCHPWLKRAAQTVNRECTDLSYSDLCALRALCGKIRF